MDWTHRLRLRNLRMVVSLSETQNVSRTAVDLNMSQPALSKWLKELEEDLGVTLFERHARGLRPTPQGQALVEHARRIEAQLDLARDDMAVIRDGGRGMVTIGTSGASAADTVPLSVLKLLGQSPQTHVRLVESTMDRLLEQLARGELDIVVGRSMPEYSHSAIRSEDLYVEPIHLVARPRHPLFGKPQLQWADLMAYRWVLWPRGTPIRNALEAAVAQAGQVIPSRHMESNSVTLNLTLLNNSDMISVASHRAALRFAQMNAMRILPLRLSAFGSVAVYWRRDGLDRPAVAQGLQCLRAVVAEQANPADSALPAPEDTDPG
jgi:DNA-binding transcriptional LysR family regulator